MANGGNDRDFGVIDGMGYQLVIERPQIFHGTAAPAYNQQIRQLVPIGIPDGSRYLPGGFRSLNPHRQKPDPGQRVTLSEDPQHIVNGRAGRAGDDANHTGIFGKRLFVPGIKKPLGCQLRFELFKSGIQVPYPIHYRGSAVELKRAVPGIHRDPPHGDHLHSVFRTKTQPLGV